MELSAKIKAKRESLGLTIKEMSDALGFGKDGDRLFRQWEKGEERPTDEQYRLIETFASTTPFQTPESNTRFKFIDLFAGIGGIRIPFQELGGQCVFTL